MPQFNDCAYLKSVPHPQNVAHFNYFVSFVFSNVISFVFSNLISLVYSNLISLVYSNLIGPPNLNV